MQSTRLVEDDGAQSTGVLHGQLQRGIGFFFTRVVMDDSATEGGTLVWVEVMTSKFVTGHPADGMNKVATVEIFKPILIRVMRVGTMIKV